MAVICDFWLRIGVRHCVFAPKPNFMLTDSLFLLVSQALQRLPEAWKTQYAAFLHEEHLRNFCLKMETYRTQGIPKQQLLPHFDEEITPPLVDSWAHFSKAMEAETVNVWATAFEQIPFEHILLLMGQRLTSASLRNEQAIPPLRETLLAACLSPYNAQTSMATRAWEKHVGRSADNFFGTVKGNPTEKEQTVRGIIHRMFAEQTWWNTFHHYKHGSVYEIREPGGHGIRWTADGQTFIGFLEPFL